MASRSKKMEEVKSVITSLLVTYKNPYEIELVRLNSDYQNNEGERIPYQTFNYATLHDFLRTIPCIEVYQRNGRHYLNFHGTDSTRHLTELVSKQRSFSKSRSRSLSCRKIPSQYHSRPVTIQPSPPQNQSLPATIVFEVRDIIRSAHRGVSQKKIVEIIRRKYPAYSFQGLREHLKSLASEISVDENMVYANRYRTSTHSKTPSERSVSASSPRSVEQRTENINTSNVTNESREHAASKYIIGGQSDEERGNDDYEDLDDDDNHSYKNNISIRPPKQSASNFIGASVSEKESARIKTAPVIREKKEVQPVIETQKECLSSDDLFSKGVEIVSATLNDRVQIRLKHLIQNRPRGIWCQELPEIYKEEYKISLNWSEYGFQRISDFAKYLPHIFHVIGPRKNGDFLLYDANKELPQSNGHEETIARPSLASFHNIYDYDEYIQSEALPAKLTPEEARQMIPADVLSIGETVGQISVTIFQEVAVGHREDYKPVRVVDAFSPSFFFIRLAKREARFDDMMRDLEEFYSANAHKYTIPKLVLEKGLNVAAKFDNIWHRGIIKHVKLNYQVQVLFYDYGTLSTLNPDRVFYLKRSFSKLPAQAIPCGLYKVKPVQGNEWSREVKSFFVQWSCDPKRELWALVKRINIQENSMLLSLTDIGIEEIHIADLLYDKNLAIPGEMDTVVDPENLSLYAGDYGIYDSQLSIANADEQLPITDRQRDASSSNVNPPGVSLPDAEIPSLVQGLVDNEANQLALNDAVKNYHESGETNQVEPTRVDKLKNLLKIHKKVSLDLDEIIRRSSTGPQLESDLMNHFVTLIEEAFVTSSVPPGLTQSNQNIERMNEMMAQMSIGDPAKTSVINYSTVVESFSQYESSELMMMNQQPTDATFNTTTKVTERFTQYQSTEPTSTITEESEIEDDSKELPPPTTLLKKITLTPPKLTNVANGNIDTQKRELTEREKLEASISSAAEDFFIRINHSPSPSSVENHVKLCAEEWNDSNPFKKVLLAGSTDFYSEDTCVIPVRRSTPPPLPSRPATWRRILPPNVSFKDSMANLIASAEFNGDVQSEEDELNQKSDNCNGESLEEIESNQKSDNYIGNSLEEAALCPLEQIDDDCTANDCLSVVEDDKSTEQLPKDDEKIATVNEDPVCVNEAPKLAVTFLAVDLPKLTVHILCLENDGFITMDHLRLAFTTFGDNETIYQYFELINCKLSLRVLTKDEYPLELQQYARLNKHMKGLREEITGALTIVTIKHMLKMLYKMTIITRAEIDNMSHGVTDNKPSAKNDVGSLIHAFNNHQKNQN